MMQNPDTKSMHLQIAIAVYEKRVSGKYSGHANNVLESTVRIGSGGSD
jgi:hypothetical protein